MDQQDRTQQHLAAQAQQIERVFAQHHLEAQVVGGHLDGDETRFDIFDRIGVGLEQLRALKDRLIASLRVPTVNLYREHGRLRVEFVQPSGAPVELFSLLDSVPPLAPLTAAVGLDGYGEPVLLDLNAPALEHVLVAGDAGAGKTAILRTIAISLALNNRQATLQLVVIDPTARDGEGGETLRPLDHVPHLMLPVVANIAAAHEALRFLADEVSYRLRHRWHTPRIVLLLDGFDHLLAEESNFTLDAITYLLQNGREAGVQIVLSTRRGVGLNRALKAHFPLRFVGQMNSTTAARSASGSRQVDAASLLGAGDFLRLTADEQDYFQAAFLGDYDLRLALEQLQRPRQPILLAQPAGQRPHLAQAAPAPAVRTFDVEPATGRVAFSVEASAGDAPPAVEFIEFGG